MQTDFDKKYSVTKIAFPSLVNALILSGCFKICFLCLQFSQVCLKCVLAWIFWGFILFRVSPDSLIC